MIAMYVQANHRDWDVHIPEFRHAINTATQKSLQVSPAFLNYGRQPTPVKSLRREVEGPKPVVPTDPAVWKDRVTRLDALRDLVAQLIDGAREKQARQYDKGRRVVEFNVGDLVWRKEHQLSNAGQNYSAKLAQKYEGPYHVLEKLSPVVYKLETANKKQNPKAHVSDLKRYLPRRGR